jgi:hypothetical protein
MSESTYNLFTLLALRSRTAVYAPGSVLFKVCESIEDGLPTLEVDGRLFNRCHFVRGIDRWGFPGAIF